MDEEELKQLSDEELRQVIDKSQNIIGERVAARTDEVVAQINALAASIQAKATVKTLPQLQSELVELQQSIDELRNQPTSPPQPSAVVAFPGAEGFGASTRGGRGGRIIEVTNLNDSGPGSLREALLATGPRIVVFRVGGAIFLRSRVDIVGAERSFLTIAGQTAPGGGIQIQGADIFLVNGVHDVIVRNLRFRTGKLNLPLPANIACLGLFGASAAEKVYNVIIDHCSLAWGYDETGSCWQYVENVTWQWCIFEGASFTDPATNTENPAKSMLLGCAPGFGNAMKNITVHHCLLANGAQRQPAITGDGPTHFINNTVYNWLSFGTEMSNQGDGIRVNLIGNFYQRGPANPNSQRYAVGIYGSRPQPDGLIYVRDNIGPYRENDNQPEWDIVGSGFQGGQDFWTVEAPQSLQRLAPWPSAAVPVTVNGTAEAVELVMANAGAFPRDSVDTRIVQDFRTNNGFIKDHATLTVADYPVLEAGSPPLDSDRDGMPDSFELQMGLNPNDPSDRNTLAPSGYTWIEEYINGLVIR